MTVNLGNLKAKLDGNSRGMAECMAELEREINLRIRLYPDWITSRKLSSMEAMERLERMAKAGELLQMVFDGKTVELEAMCVLERLNDAESSKPEADAVPTPSKP